jgi:hypothetical protein
MNTDILISARANPSAHIDETFQDLREGAHLNFVYHIVSVFLSHNQKFYSSDH